MAYTLKDIAAMSMGHQVALMNSLFTRKLGDAPAGSQNAINQHSYTVSEWGETKEALEHSYVSDELRDGIADMFTTLIGSIWRAGNTEMFLFLADQSYVQRQNLGSQNNLTTTEAKLVLDDIEVIVSDTSKLLSLTGDNSISNNLLHRQLNRLAIKLFEFSLFIGINPHADLSQVTMANLSKLCQGRSCLERTYEKYADIGVQLYHTEVEPDVYAVFSKEHQVGTDGKTYEADKFLKSADWFEPFFPSLTTDSALAHANVSAAVIQATPKVDLVDGNGNPLI